MAIKPAQMLIVSGTLVSLLALAGFVYWQNKTGAPSPTKTAIAPAQAAVPANTPVSEAPPTDADCSFRNSNLDEMEDFPAFPADLQFNATIDLGSSVAFAVPFLLKPGQTFDFSYTGEIDTTQVAQCVTDSQAIRCNEVFEQERHVYCPELELADGSRKIIKLILTVHDKAPPLPVGLEKFAVKSQTPSIGLIQERLRDDARTQATGLPAYKAIQIWESADPQARLVGEVPSGFYLTQRNPYIHYLEKVGDRYLSNVLAQPNVYHWVSGVSGMDYETMFKDQVLCDLLELELCQNPSTNDCRKKMVNASIGLQPDPKDPIVRGDGEWVVLVSKNQPDQKLYMPLQSYLETTHLPCD